MNFVNNIFFYLAYLVTYFYCSISVYICLFFFYVFLFLFYYRISYMVIMGCFFLYSSTKNNTREELCSKQDSYLLLVEDTFM